MADQVKDILSKLCSKAKLDRDRGHSELQAYLKVNQDEEILENLQHDIISLLNSASSEWETNHGALHGALVVLEYRKSTGNLDDNFSMLMVEKSLGLLDHAEFRVRIAAGKFSFKSKNIKISILFVFKFPS